MNETIISHTKLKMHLLSMMRLQKIINNKMKTRERGFKVQNK